MRGWWWFWFRNVKYIQQNSDGSIQGHNVAWGWLKWGDFDVDVQSDPEVMCFDYKHFVDIVALCHGEDVASGNLYIRGAERSTFTMTRILPEVTDETD